MATKKKATPVVKKAGKSAVKKAGAKKITASKSASKKQLAKKPLAKKTTKPIIKSSLAKKSAKPVVKKAASKKLSTNKKNVAKKLATSPKKSPAPKKTTLQQKPKIVSAKAPVINISDHKKELKKALKNAIKNETAKKPAKPFVMPKTNTEKSRKYEPQFIKSVLDQAPEEDNGPTMRYSDAELNEFKDLISRKLETAKKELGYLQGLITRKDEMGGDDTDNRYMTMEDGSLSMEREQLSQMASRQITFIDHLEKAMMRIENKTYGICRVTGKLIDKARLRAVPHATLSIEAKMGIAK